MKKQNSKFMKVAASLMCTAFLFACSNDSEKVSIDNASTVKGESLSTIGDQDLASVISEHVSYSDEDFYDDWENATSIQLNGSDTSFEGDDGVSINKSIITITTSGVYEIQGKLDDGQIIVDTEDDGIVRLILNGAEIHSSSTSAIYVKQAEKTIVSLKEGTENVLSDGAKYVYENSEED